jgi:CRISPR-associated protein Cmr3
MSTDLSWWFIEPVDVWSFRGNLGFGEGSEVADTLLVPRPQTVTGALRSSLLATLTTVERAHFHDDTPIAGDIGSALGTARHPGTLHVVWTGIARTAAGGRLRALVPAPLDLVGSRSGHAAQLTRRRVIQELPTRVRAYLPHGLGIAVSRTGSSKGFGGYLTDTGFRTWLQGKTPAADDFIPAEVITAPNEHGWVDIEPRLGIALDSRRRTASTGRLYVTQYVRYRPGVGIVVAAVGVRGATAEHLDGALVRLGGDGRAAVVTRVAPPDGLASDDRIAWHSRALLIAVTPGVFARGWVPDGFEEEGDGYLRARLGGVTLRLDGIVLGRPTTISGWSLAPSRGHRSVGQPRPPATTVPEGSVWFLTIEQGESHAIDEFARDLRVRSINAVLTGRPGARDAEGYSQCWLGSGGEETSV